MHIVYQHICHKIPNQIKVVLNVFIKIKLKFYCIKVSQNAQTAQCQNSSNFEIEFLDMNINNIFKTG